MSICDFCLEFEAGEKCRLGLKLPKRMGCRAFGPAMDKFCSNPEDFVDPKQVVQMASYFGMKGSELKKVQAMAALAESTRLSLRKLHLASESDTPALPDALPQ